MRIRFAPLSPASSLSVPITNSDTPRVFKTNVGDIYTTNCVGAANTDGKAEYAGIEIAEKDVLTVNAQGFLVVGTGDIEFEVVKVYTMADGQPAVKIMRIK